MPTPEKATEIAELERKLAANQLGVLADYRGLTVGELQTLRRQLRQAGGELQVAKNTFLRIAADRIGVHGLEPMLAGPTAIALTDRNIAELTKALTDYARTSKVFTIKGGYLGRKPLKAEDVERIASLPSREQLLSQLLGGMQAPMANLAGVLNATVASIVRVLDARRAQLAGESAG